MIQPQTQLTIADNTGARKIMCIRVLCGNKNFSSVGENKIHLESEKSDFNLNCISASEFPLTDENFNEN